MRIPRSRGRLCRMAAQLFITVAATSMLAACSNSIERFSNAYNNPSDTDPVYTASVPQKVQKPAYQRPTYQAASADETIIESPVAKAPLPMQQPSYDYEQSYKKTYKQPAYAATRPRVKLNQLPPPEEEVALVEESVDEPVAKKLPFKVKSSSSGENEQPILKLKKRKIIVADAEEPVVVKSKSRGGLHTVGSGETLYSLGRTYGISPFVIADANGLSHDQTLRLGQQVKIPGARKIMAAAEPETTDAVQEETPVAPKLKLKKKAPLSLAEDEQVTDDTDQQVATDEPVVKPKAIEKSQEQIAETPTPASGMSLRWPVKGKIISGFGPKANGLKNEGINIAVPEGTSIRAADGGVVAYAGSELKGYGNLVLIRHAGGYVTAYAHAKELLVKRGDTVKRGDIIAKAGQTGAVSSPQLHFEVRKGATALDPIKNLASVTAMN